MKKTSAFLLGIPIGALNILLGAGGGMIAVPALKKCGLNQKQAQANAVAVILPLTIISLIIYTKKEYVNFFDSLWILPFAAGGALLGTVGLEKISAPLLKKIFAGFMIWAGVRMFMKS